jgi:MFS family permease
MSASHQVSVEPGSVSSGSRVGWRAVLGGNVLWLSVVSLLNDAASEMIYPLLPYFLVGTLGAAPALLGLIEGVAESTASFLKLASGWLSDRVRRRKPLVFWGYAIASCARPLVGIVSAPWQLLAVRFADRVGKGIRSAPRDALLAESVPATRRGLAFGLHRAADHAGAVIGPLLASGLLLLLPGRLRWVFLLAFIPGVLSLLVIAFRVRERAAASGQAEAGAGPSAGGTDMATDASGGKPASPAGLLSRAREAARGPLAPFLVVLVIFTLGNATDAFLLLRAQDLGVPLALIPLLWGVHHVSKMLWNVAGGLLADRLGPRRAIVAGWLVYALTYGAFAFASTAWHAWALFLCYGLFYGLTEAPEKALIAQLAPAGRRGAAFGAYHFAIGIAALPASLIFGVIWSTAGARPALLYGGGLALLASLALPLLVRLPACESAA